jgi:hypothetical protein
MWGLLVRAKHLFVATIVCMGCGVTWLNEGGAPPLDQRKSGSAVQYPPRDNTLWDKTLA